MGERRRKVMRPKLGSDRVQAENDTGFLDVSANALAAVMLITMLALALSAPPKRRGAVAPETASDLVFPTPVGFALSPLNSYFLVTRRGLYRLDLKTLANKVGPGSTSVQIPGIELTFLIDRSGYRDLDEYRARLVLDWDAIDRQGPGLEIAKTSQHAFAEFLTQRQGPYGSKVQTFDTFILAPDAVSTFAEVYWQLRGDDTPLRWVLANAKGEVTLTRSSSTFETRRRSWQ